MSAEEYAAAAKRSIEGLAKSAGCDYVSPGTSLVSEGRIEGGEGYGGNLNLRVAAHLADGTAITGLTLPIMVAQNTQPTGDTGQSSATQSTVPPTTNAPPQQAPTPQGLSVAENDYDSGDAETIKGQCVGGAACDSVALIRATEHKDHVEIMFMRGNRALYGFSGRLYFDSVDGDNKVAVDHVYSPGGQVLHYSGGTGEESTSQMPGGWQPQGGVCELSQAEGHIGAIECGQPMWSFQAAPGQ